jgi:hypothetical protein
METSFIEGKKMTIPPLGSDHWRVAVLATPDDLQALAEVLSRVGCIHPTDAHVQARKSPGILAETFPRPLAEQLAKEIRTLGVRALAVADSAIPTLEETVATHHVRCEESGLSLRDLHGREESLIPWERIDLVSVGQVPQEHGRHFVMGDMNAVASARRTGAGSVETTGTPGPEALIVCSEPFRSLRIDHKRMNYEYLAERKTDSATANFREFLNDLVSRAPHAYLTPSTRAWLEHGSVADYSFSSAHELERNTRLHLLIQRSGRESGPG